MLDFDRVSFSFSGRRDTFELLRDVSFSCKEDEIVAVIGPSRCGKSTLLSLAIALRTPTRGEVRVNGASGARAGSSTWHAVSADNSASLALGGRER
jgi:ABC-type nitrate/sulfonate/bicarbonate transport system ATPase subunit